jgi:hypothetical protein
MRFMHTGVREPVTEAELPMPVMSPFLPSRKEFARTYYAQTPVSFEPNHLLPLSCYMAKLLTLAQTCREREVLGTLVMVLRVRRAMPHRCTMAAVLPVLLLEVLLVVSVVILLLFTYTETRRLI